MYNQIIPGFPFLVLFFFALLLMGCSASAQPKKSSDEKAEPATADSEEAEVLELATLAGGCFWCIEAVYNRIEGVKSTVSGYMGGHVDDPTYTEVCSGLSGHAEVVQVAFDPKVLTYGELLSVFWQAHDPTTLDRQGADVGPQYRSAIYYHSAEQKAVAEASKKKYAVKFNNPIVSEITEASKFYPATDDHQEFYENNPDSGYCRAVIAPKLEKLGMKLTPVD